MDDVRLDPQQVPARAELLLAVELGEDAPGRPIYARLEPDGDGEPAGRIKVGAVLTRRLCARTPIELRIGLIVILIGPATDGGRPLDRFLRVEAARSNASLGDIASVTHAADRLNP